MVRTSVCRSAFLLLVGLFTGAPLSAQSIPSPYRFIEEGREISAFVGYFGGADGQFGFGSGGSVTVGGRFGLEISGPLAADLVVWFSPTTRDVINPAGTEGPSVLGEADLNLAGIEVRPRLSLTGRRTWRGLQPYVMAGIGLIHDFAGAQVADLGIPVEDRFDFGTAFSASAGAGIRVLPTDRLVGRLELAGIFHQLDTPGGFSDPDLELGVVPEDEWVVAPALTLSLGIRF